MSPDTRAHVHELIDSLPPGQLAAIETLLESILDDDESLQRSLAAAPVEDEEITPEMAARLDRARASAERGETIPHEEILQEFGLD